MKARCRRSQFWHELLVPFFFLFVCVMPPPPGCPTMCTVLRCGEPVAAPSWDAKRHCYGNLASSEMHMHATCHYFLFGLSMFGHQECATLLLLFILSNSVTRCTCIGSGGRPSYHHVYYDTILGLKFGWTRITSAHLLDSRGTS